MTSRTSQIDRVYSKFSIKNIDGAQRTFSGIATTGSTDRQQDIVEPLGGEFHLPLPMLWAHAKGAITDPIGWITKAHATASGIRIEGKIAKPAPDYPDGLRDDLNRAWVMVRDGLVRGLSIGFQPLEWEPNPRHVGIPLHALVLVGAVARCNRREPRRDDREHQALRYHAQLVEQYDRAHVQSRRSPAAKNRPRRRNLSIAPCRAVKTRAALRIADSAPSGLAMSAVCRVREKPRALRQELAAGVYRVGQMHVQRKREGEFVKTWIEHEGQRVIQGVAVTARVTTQDWALEPAGGRIDLPIPLLCQHGFNGESLAPKPYAPAAIGIVTALWRSDRVIRARAVIDTTAAGDAAWRLIVAGELCVFCAAPETNSLRLRGIVDEARFYSEWQLEELSIARADEGINPDARFTRVLTVTS